MSSYNPNNSEFSSGLQSSVTNKGLGSKVLRALSNFGMQYDDMVIRNRVGVGQNEDPQMLTNTSMYDFFSQRAVASVLSRKSIPYLDRAYADKRRILRSKVDKKSIFF